MPLNKLFIDIHSVDDPVTDHFTAASGMTPTIVRERDELYQHIKIQKDPWTAGKRALLLTRNRGSFLKDCPGTRDYTCCGYKILHIGSYCTMDCSYCILQSYFHPPILHYFTNHDDLFAELDGVFARSTIQRIGTGEFTDSLIWEQWSHLTGELVRRFSQQNHAVLELKTKTTAIGKLKRLDHNHKTIVSWSLNTPKVIASEERGTASLRARLNAAVQCQKWGYPLAFHFDPMIIYPGCEADYRDVLNQLFSKVPANQVVWISLGTLRFMPALKSIIEQRFSDSTIVYGEFIPGLDGKMRYFKRLRIELYRRMVQWIRELAPEVTTYLCMEDDQVWRSSFGYTPADRGGLPAMLDAGAAKHCRIS